MSDESPKPGDGDPLDTAYRVTTRSSRLRQLTPKAMWTTAVVIAVLTTAAVVLLWWPATAGLNGADLVRARLDALKIGLSIGVGSGGVIALYLAWRRQHSTEADLDTRERTLAHQQEVAADTKEYQERIAEDARQDASARRITELYTKSVEQLGSDKAPVRLGGIYALERLAQENESQRQTIVNVLCAYLRMPQKGARKSPRKLGEKVTEAGEDAQEREVRSAVQQVITDHLKPELGAAYWGPCDLDLSGASLRNLDLAMSSVGSVRFSGAKFSGPARFSHVVFEGNVTAHGASFSSYAAFDNATFRGALALSEVIFGSDCTFSRTLFQGSSVFTEVTFDGLAEFMWAKFQRSAQFISSKFASVADFSEAEFGHLTIRGTKFLEDAKFRIVDVDGPVAFEKLHFDKDVDFTGSAFAGFVSFIDMLFSAEVSFRRVQFGWDPEFQAVEFAKDPVVTGAATRGADFKLER
ncbi:pentapeptide repeat-containing protein [Amycolatopsis sp. NPDC004079]|uniref:pentapeptide repeat-containing protein n=1 Tax=Amycolatopsis sp. NPDC004079 TaxID=3154549 RepID=UPI0033A8A6CB